MQKSKRALILGILLPTWLAGLMQAAPLDTAFTDEGRLTEGGQLADGHYDIRFSLYPTDAGGTLVGVPLTNANVVAAEGLFRTTLDFGAGVFNGTAYWLELGVRTNGSVDPFVLLSPRQALTAAPYAALRHQRGHGSHGHHGGLDAVTGDGIQNFTITAEKIVNGEMVKSLNGLKDMVTLAVGANLSLTPRKAGKRGEGGGTVSCVS